MATITEDYVSFETAKLLKEKGFPQEYDIYHSMVYNEEDYEDEYEVQRMVLETKLVKAGTLSSYPINVPEPKCYCCTLQMAMRWLREEMGLVIIIDYSWLLYAPIPYYFHIYTTSGNNGGREDDLAPINPYYDYKYKTYEEACEAAIKYCLENLI